MNKSQQQKTDQIHSENSVAAVSYTKLLSLIMAILCVAALPCILQMEQAAVGMSNSIVSLVVIWGMYELFQKGFRILKKEKAPELRKLLFSILIALFCVLTLILGKGLDQNGEIPLKEWWSYVSMLIYLPIVTFGSYCVMCFLEQREETYDKKDQTPDDRISRKCILLTAAGFIVAWLPVLLAVYPGFFVYDAQDEYVQVATRNFSTHHPLVHVLMLGGMICGVHKFTDSYNLGIFCYMLFQMVVLAGIFGFFLDTCRRKQIKKAYRIVFFLYFALYPVIVMFTLCSAKDTLFGGLMLLALILFKEGLETERFWKQKGKVFVLTVSICGMMLLRHNAIYGLAAALVLYLFLLKNEKKLLIKIAMLFFVAFLGQSVISGGLKLALHADDSENQEMLTVPIQQIARSHWADPDQFTDEELEILYEILPKEALGRYTPNLADPVKCDFNNDAYNIHKKEFWKIWGKGLINQPVGYVNAWLMTSYGYWYPDMIVNVYEGHTVFTFTYDKSSFFGFETENPGTRDSKIPWLEEWYRVMSLDDTMQKIPGISMLFSMGAVFWCYAIGLLVLLARKRTRLVLPFIMPIMIWLTLLLGPTFVPRYICYLWYCLPFLSVTVWQGLEKEEKELV